MTTIEPEVKEHRDMPWIIAALAAVAFVMIGSLALAAM